MKYRIKCVVNERGQKYYNVQFRRLLVWKTLQNVGGPRTFWALSDAIDSVKALKEAGPPRVSYISA
jgi:hypothetical protein